MFLDVFTEYSNDAYQQGVKASGKVFDIPTDAIKIYPCFASHSPKAEKMEQKEQYFAETGLLQSQIILDSRGNLIDGYTSYLLARAHGIQCVPIRYGRRQIVRASHKPGGLYACCPTPHYRKAVLIMARLVAGTRKRADGTLEKRFTIDGRRYSIYARKSKELVQKEQEIRKKIEAGIFKDNFRA